ncbi:caskin-2-like [Oppia nitens]|uniref:caskin-2-like n=1 Tax=Oppia nitens TaxID=1686743 RepID=UPI0023DB04A2|nr:caskin-2-like [Oppia nitens]
MRNLSIQMTDHTNNGNGGIVRQSPSRTSIRISPPIAPNNANSDQNKGNPRITGNGDPEPQLTSPTNNLMSQTNDDYGNMYSHQYYDSNNYLSHMKLNKYAANVNQSAISASNMCTLSVGVSGQSITTPITAIVNGMTSVNLNPNSMNNSRASLEDHGVDVGRVSPSTSSNDSRKSRYSSASLDSGRGSDTKTSAQSHRVSVHSCESLGSQLSTKDNYNHNSASSSSIGSGNSVTVDVDINTTNNVSTVADPNWTPVSASTSITGPLSIPEMVLHGIPDEEIIHTWLSRIHYEEYVSNFIKAGYDMPTISRMTPEDLTAIGITKPQKRQNLKTEIQKLTIADGIPNFKPNSLLEWLKLLRLEEYFTILCQQGYNSIDRVTELAWEDLEEVGITKLGHQKKIMLAIKKIKNINNNINSCKTSESTHNLSLPLIYNNNSSSCDGMARPNNNGYNMSFNSQYQDTVAIKMFAPTTKSTPSPTTEQLPPIAPQLKTFQQLPINRFMYSRQRSDVPYTGFLSNDTQNMLQSSRGRSLESLDYNDSNYHLFWSKQSNHMLNGFPKQQQMPYSESYELTQQRESEQIHGYETDNEVINNYANNRRTMYEIDGTATLHRPKGMVKAKPVAKIVAKTRPPTQPDVNTFNQIYDTQKKYEPMSQSDNNLKNNFICDDNSSSYYQDVNPQIYASIKRKKTPPPPPKRVNSMRNTLTTSSPIYSGTSIPSFSSPLSPLHSHHRQSYDGYDQFQEQVFASCVKNLTSRFSMKNMEDTTPSDDKTFKGCADDFPPPPSPLSFNDCQNYNTLQRKKKDKNDRQECNISSSSSTESMPFANDNIGTIKQNRVNPEYNKDREIHSPSPSFTCSAPPSLTNSPSSTSPHSITNDQKNFVANQSPVKLRSVDNQRNGIRPNGMPLSLKDDPLDDIETMLVNLSNQLDLMLETDHRNK